MKKSLVKRILDKRNKVFKPVVYEEVPVWGRDPKFKNDNTQIIPVATNGVAKDDAGKLQLSLVPTEIIRGIAQVRMFGTKKYKSPENWRTVSMQRYIDAAYRHFLAFLDDPNSVDEESGLPHIYHLACNLAFICELRKAGEHGGKK